MKSAHLHNLLTYGVLFLAAFLFVFLFSCTTSPLYEHHPFWFHGDSGIFQEMGVCLVQGGTPYVDLFDHKGPILWFIQALGIWISPRWGIMILQSISLFCTLVLWYKTALLVIEKRWVSFAISLSGLLFLMAFYQRGNLCEEWCLPFISLPLYLYFYRSGKNQLPQPLYTTLDSFIIGLCVGVIAMIRLNNTAPIIGFVLWDFITCLKHKEYKKLWTNISAICAGMVVIFLGCALFYLVKAGWNGVYEMIYGTFVFNLLYFEAKTSLPFLSTIQHYILPVVFLLTLIILMFKNKENNTIIIPGIISFVATIFAIGSFEFWHYTMIFIPLFVLASVLSIKDKSTGGLIILGLAILYSCFIGYEAADHLLFRLRGKTANTEINDGFHRFIESIPENERKSIYNAGLNHLGAGLFADENTYQCNHIIYGGHVSISPRLQEYQKNHGIKELHPAWVLTQGTKPIASDEYMQTHYSLTDSIPGGEFDPIWCWKKNSQLHERDL